MWPVILVAILVVGFLIVLRGAPELAKLRVVRGNLRLLRGRMPGRLLDDFRDVLSDPALDGAELRIVSENGRPRLVARGLDDAREQRLRNVLGPYTIAQLRAGQRRPRRER